MTTPANANGHDRIADSNKEIMTMNSAFSPQNGSASLTGGGSADYINSAPTASTAATALPVPARAPHPRMDWIPRLRDRWGNRLAWGYAYSLPVMGEAKIADTAREAALLRIEQEHPLLAGDIRDCHDRELMPARKEHEKAIAYEHSELARRNAEARTVNDMLVVERADWEARRDAATEPHVADVRNIEDHLLPTAHETTGRIVAAAGGFYDPENPSDACVLRHERRPLETIAAELKLPWAPGDSEETRASVWTWVCICATGVLLGIGLGLAVHMLAPYTLLTKWPVTLGCAAVGIPLAYAMKQAICGAWRHAGQNYYSRQPGTKWGLFLAGAFLRTALIITAEVCMERQGLLGVMNRNASAAALSSGTAGISVMDQLVSWIIPLVISTPLLFWAKDQGYLKGRRHEVDCRLRERQEEVWREEDAERRSDPRVIAALEAISHVRMLIGRRAALQGRIAEITAPFENRIAEILARRLATSEELSLDAKHRIQEIGDNVLGAQEKFNNLWEQARWEVEPSGSCWARFWRDVFGPRRAGRKSRERLLK
ncbi:hypothetical protein CCAX7_35670 [Capsulimonas corticalis]|uniref:Uncharacterized protein n=1 Tax=Capsulimonas corticalis TaxID=2219043 RepID=A0A402D657_9BACT|nr:hypothetical protein [Capsulimonas corticalis]BDI31516.1 hypothetical protein CCAX7_35670 [Capsulimonas corticalis]